MDAHCTLRSSQGKCKLPLRDRPVLNRTDSASDGPITEPEMAGKRAPHCHALSLATRLSTVDVKG